MHVTSHRQEPCRSVPEQEVVNLPAAPSEEGDDRAAPRAASEPPAIARRLRRRAAFAVPETDGEAGSAPGRKRAREPAARDSDSLEMAQALVTHGADVTKARPPEGMTPTYVACMHGHLNIVKFLCEEHGADPGVADFAGESALSLAADHHDAESLRIMVENYTSPRRGDSSELSRALERAIVTRNK